MVFAQIKELKISAVEAEGIRATRRDDMTFTPDP